VSSLIVTTDTQNMADNVPHAKIIIELDSNHSDLNKLKEEVQRMMVERTLGETRGNLAEAARRLGISRPTLYSLMSRYGLSRDRHNGLAAP